MTITYPIDCFERDLIITFPDGYEQYSKEIISCLDEAYDRWHGFEKIEDPEERQYVQFSCCEEYMIECLSDVFNQWEEWTSKEWEEE